VLLKPGDMVMVNNVMENPIIKVRSTRYCDINPRVPMGEFDVSKYEVGVVLALVECPIAHTDETMVLFGTRFGWTWDNCWKRC